MAATKKAELFRRIRACANMYQEGKSTLEIAKTLNITDNQVISALKDAESFGMITFEARNDNCYCRSRKLLDAIITQLELTEDDVVELISENNDSLTLRVIYRRSRNSSETN